MKLIDRTLKRQGQTYRRGVGSIVRADLDPDQLVFFNEQVRDIIDYCEQRRAPDWNSIIWNYSQIVAMAIQDSFKDGTYGTS